MGCLPPAARSCQREETAAGLGGAGYITCAGGPSRAHSQALFPARQPAPGWGCWAGAWHWPPSLTICVWNVQMFPWGLRLAPRPRPAFGLGSGHPGHSPAWQRRKQAALDCRTESWLVWGLCFLNSKGDCPQSCPGNVPDLLSPGPSLWPPPPTPTYLYSLSPLPSRPAGALRLLSPPIPLHSMGCKQGQSSVWGG